MMRVLDTLTITDDDGKILSTVMKDSPEGQVILGLQARVAHHEHDHSHPHEDQKDADPVSDEIDQE